MFSRRTSSYDDISLAHVNKLITCKDKIACVIRYQIYNSSAAHNLKHIAHIYLINRHYC